MKKHTSSRSGLLLMEIIIAILFFSVVSAICLQLFVKAHNMGADTEELDMAVRQCSSVAEILSQGGQPAAQLDDLSDDGGFIYFNEDFQTCKKDDSQYHLDISSSPEDTGVTTYDIALYANDDTECIYSLKVDTYRQHMN